MHITTFLENYRRIITEQIDAITHLLNDNQIKSMAEGYLTLKSSHKEEPFNVFKLASDLYYRENFHSDIIKAFLDPHEKHKVRYLVSVCFH